MLYESNASTDRRCKVQDVPLAWPVPNLPAGLESNHKEILLFTHLMYNCIGNLLFFASRELEDHDS